MDSVAQLTRLGLFDTRVPRYTSYPPANWFSDQVGAGQTADWLSELDPGQPVSLYLHIPFCRRLCWFCACRTQGVRSDAPIRTYLEGLKQEIALVADLLPTGVRIGRLHWGGGTPTLLSPEMIADLNAALRARFTFAPDVDFSVEIDPNQFDQPRAEALARAGMTRASIGIQDFDTDIQHLIGRIQDYDTTAAAVKMLRSCGIRSINADILYGLPTQTTEGIARTVQMLLSLSPDRVALYGYAHVPWMARRQNLIPTESLPNPNERFDLFETARKLFLWDGYTDIGIDHFARPRDSLAQAADSGRLRRNFQGYTDDTCPTLIGLGASAISKFPQGFAQNAPGTAAYLKSARAGRMATVRGHVLSGEDRLRARIIEALMCDFAVNFAEMKDGFGMCDADIGRLFLPAAKGFSGVTSLSPARFEILPEGRPLTRIIARHFDTYVQSETAHSGAI